jgi:NAD(P)-dependent dehydrogenase (short-subunit alcohol dehydrogenase family)
LTSRPGFAEGRERVAGQAASHSFQPAVSAQPDAAVALRGGQRRGFPMDVKGRTILVTGSTDGVGRMVAERVGAAGARVLVHGRNRDRGGEVVGRIVKAGGQAQFLEADLASLAGVRTLADAVARETQSLDVLVNNAGIGATGEREASADGVELHFAVNYLAGFLLTRLLLPLIAGRTPSRVVNVASAGQEAIDFDDVMLTRGYSGMRAYRQSKLAQILFTFDLAQELEGSGVTVNALHPATYMDTTMVRRAGAQPISTVEEGAEAILLLVGSPALEGKSGLYFNGLREAHADAQAYDAAARKKLRALSFRLVDSADPAPGVKIRQKSPPGS